MPLFGPPDIEALKARQNVRRLINTLRSYQDDRVRRAAKALADIGEPAVAPLVGALRRDSRGARAPAVGILVTIGEPAVAPLVGALRRARRNRHAVATALGKIGDIRAVEPLVAALTDRGPAIRMAAAEALGRIGHPGAVEPLVAALTDADLDVRWTVARALDVIGWIPGPDARGATYWIAALKVERCTTIGPPAVEPLCVALHDGDWGVRRDAALALAKIGDRRAVEPLIAALRDWESGVRRGAVKALGMIGDPAAVPALCAALHDSDWGIRKNAAKALGGMRAAAAVEHLFIAALRDTARDTDRYVRDAAYAALVAIGEPAVEPLRVALTRTMRIAWWPDSTRHRRCAAAELLGLIGGSRAVDALCQALRDDGHPGVRREAARALGVIGGPRAAGALRAALDDVEVRAAAAGALASIGAPADDHDGTAAARTVAPTEGRAKAG